MDRLERDVVQDVERVLTGLQDTGPAVRGARVCNFTLISLPVKNPQDLAAVAAVQDGFAVAARDMKAIFRAQMLERGLARVISDSACDLAAEQEGVFVKVTRQNGGAYVFITISSGVQGAQDYISLRFGYDPGAPESLSLGYHGKLGDVHDLLLRAARHFIHAEAAGQLMQPIPKTPSLYELGLEDGLGFVRLTPG